MPNYSEQHPQHNGERSEPSLADYARSAYLGYAALANLSQESITRGISTLELAKEDQIERLQYAFSSAAQVLMEIAETNGEFGSSETRVETVNVEGAQRSIHWVGKRYLAGLVGPIDDLVLHQGHIPVTVDFLLEAQGKLERVERRSLDMAQLLTLRFSGLSADEIALELDTKSNRVKGAFTRFNERISQRVSVEEGGRLFRERLSALNLLEYKQESTD